MSHGLNVNLERKWLVGRGIGSSSLAAAPKSLAAFSEPLPEIVKLEWAVAYGGLSRQYLFDSPNKSDIRLWRKPSKTALERGFWASTPYPSRQIGKRPWINFSLNLDWR